MSIYWVKLRSLLDPVSMIETMETRRKMKEKRGCVCVFKLPPNFILFCFIVVDS